MRIERKSRNNLIPISNIKDGECFIYNHLLHMRVGSGSVDCKDLEQFPIIVVNLEENKLNSLRSSVKVMKIDAIIVVGES